MRSTVPGMHLDWPQCVVSRAPDRTHSSVSSEAFLWDLLRNELPTRHGEAARPKSFRALDAIDEFGWLFAGVVLQGVLHKDDQLQVGQVVDE